jgi:predicted PurR-regulated permease PerM
MTFTDVETSRGAELRRWLRIWIAILVAVVLVVVGYLVFIGQALSSIDSNLASTRNAVDGVKSNTNELPGQITAANRNLSGIVAAIQPLPSTVVQIDTALGATSTNLAPTAADLAAANRLLNGTSDTLSGTAGTLGSTATVLRSVLRLAAQVDGVLVSTHPHRLGSRAISLHVDLANAALRAVRADTGDISLTLARVDTQLRSICRSALLQALGGAPRC